MSARLNKVFLIGRLGQDPEFREVGKGLCKFSLAENCSYKDKSGEWVDKTQWHNIEVWGPAAARVQNSVKKGDEVIVEGSNKVDEYTDKEGNKKTSYSISANSVKKLVSDAD